MSIRLVKSINTAQILGFKAIELRVADLNGDGIPELLLIQNYPMNREIAAMAAMDLEGNVLWKYGEPGDFPANRYSDVPVQIYDWDGDGKNEVLYIKQAFYKVAKMWQYSKGTHVIKEVHHYDEVRLDPDFASEEAVEFEGNAVLMVLDGATGQVKYSYNIPPASDDSIAFGHFDGTGKANCIVKDRYWNLYALNNDGEVLWSVKDQDMGAGIGHVPGIGDIDGDGLDEVYVSNTLFDHDGRMLWQIPEFKGHNDVAVILDDIEEKRIITCSDKVRCISPEGKVLWSYDAGHQQNVLPGRFSSDPKHGPYQFLTRDEMPWAKNYDEGCSGVHSMDYTGQKIAMRDWHGNLIWERVEPTGYYRVCRWSGKGDQLVLAVDPDENGPQPTWIVEFDGSRSDPMYLTTPEGTRLGGCSAFAADVMGDSRDEIILYSSEYISIFCNTAPCNQRRHYNFTHYNGE